MRKINYLVLLLFIVCAGIGFSNNISGSASVYSSGSAEISGASNIGSTDTPFVPNSFEITNSRWYVVPKVFNNMQNAYEVHFVFSGVTNASYLTIQTLGNKTIPNIPVVNGHFSTDQIVGYYIASAPNFQYRNRATVVANFSDGTQQDLSFTSSSMQVIFQ